MRIFDSGNGRWPLVMILVGLMSGLTGSVSWAECTRMVHTFCGLEGPGALQVRQGYALVYNHERLVPHWVAYQITPDFLRTPTRAGRFASFLVDPTIESPVRDRHYTGVEGRWGYVRGHLAPYKVMGGDRDGDGQYADLDPYVSDPDEELTIRQANQMSNIAPQHDDEFNGPGGLWGKLERWIQDDVVEDEEKTVWVVAGTIFGPGATEQVVNPRLEPTVVHLQVPPMFFKVVIEDGFTEQESRVLAFLFPHQHVSHGDITDFLVSIDVIEGMTGLDFFRDLPVEIETAIERTDTCTYWNAYYDSWWNPFSGCR